MYIYIYIYIYIYLYIGFYRTPHNALQTIQKPAGYSWHENNRKTIETSYVKVLIKMVIRSPATPS